METGDQVRHKTLGIFGEIIGPSDKYVGSVYILWNSWHGNCHEPTSSFEVIGKISNNDIPDYLLSMGEREEDV